MYKSLVHELHALHELFADLFLLLGLSKVMINLPSEKLEGFLRNKFHHFTSYFEFWVKRSVGMFHEPCATRSHISIRPKFES